MEEVDVIHGTMIGVGPNTIHEYSDNLWGFIIVELTLIPFDKRVAKYWEGKHQDGVKYCGC